MFFVFGYKLRRTVSFPQTLRVIYGNETDMRREPLLYRYYIILLSVLYAENNENLGL